MFDETRRRVFQTVPPTITGLQLKQERARALEERISHLQIKLDILADQYIELEARTLQKERKVAG